MDSHFCTLWLAPKTVNIHNYSLFPEMLSFSFSLGFFLNWLNWPIFIQLIRYILCSYPPQGRWIAVDISLGPRRLASLSNDRLISVVYRWNKPDRILGEHEKGLKNHENPVSWPFWVLYQHPKWFFFTDKPWKSIVHCFYNIDRHL